MKAILELNPDEMLALIQVLERDIIFRDLTSRVIEDLDRCRHEWANEVRNLGYLRADDSVWQHKMKQMADKKEVREAIANYMSSEGCSCCRDDEGHDEHKTKLAGMLDVERYSDNSGWDFYQYRSNKS